MMTLPDIPQKQPALEYSPVRNSKS